MLQKQGSGRGLEEETTVLVSRKGGVSWWKRKQQGKISRDFSPERLHSQHADYRPSLAVHLEENNKLFFTGSHPFYRGVLNLHAYNILQMY